MDSHTVKRLAPARDFEEFEIPLFGCEWRAWWQPTAPEEGHRHGSDGICITEDGELVIIREGEGRWDLPGGRTDEGETWEETLRREVREEACATVDEARLLGFWVADCDTGTYEGKRIIRSLWLAHVTVNDWQPEFEVTERKLISVDEWPAQVRVGSVFRPFICRAFVEAGFS